MLFFRNRENTGFDTPLQHERMMEPIYRKITLMKEPIDVTDYTFTERQYILTHFVTVKRMDVLEYLLSMGFQIREDPLYIHVSEPYYYIPHFHTFLLFIAGDVMWQEGLDYILKRMHTAGEVRCRHLYSNPSCTLERVLQHTYFDFDGSPRKRQLVIRRVIKIGFPQKFFTNIKMNTYKFARGTDIQELHRIAMALVLVRALAKTLSLDIVRRCVDSFLYS